MDVQRGNGAPTVWEKRDALDAKTNGGEGGQAMNEVGYYSELLRRDQETERRRRRERRIAERARREQRHRDDKMIAYMAAVCGIVFFMFMIAVAAFTQQTAKAIQPKRPVIEMPSVVMEEPDVSYRRDDIPLNYELQDRLHEATDKYNLPYKLVLAQMWRESCYRNVTGDGGNSEGYLQVQEKWHNNRMKRLGVSDLKNPAGNFLVACDYLRECVDTTDTIASALTKYNSGEPGKNQYAIEVLEKWEQLGGEECGGS